MISQNILCAIHKKTRLFDYPIYTQKATSSQRRIRLISLLVNRLYSNEDLPLPYRLKKTMLTSKLKFARKVEFDFGKVLLSHL